MAEIALYTAVSGMQSAMEEIRIRANNVSNVNSLGYQSHEVETKDSFYNNVIQAGVSEAADVGERPVGVQIGTGSRVKGTYRKLEPGAIKQTDNPLDISIKGSGYFAITLPNSVRGYTRGGAFQLNNQRQVVTSEGYLLADGLVIPDNIPSTAINISDDGTVTGTDPTTGIIVNIGNVQVYSFANENGLQLIGNGYLTETVSSGEGQGHVPGESGTGQLSQGTRELSNVKIANEFADFMAAQQAYDMSSKIMRSVDEMLKELNK